MIPSNSSKRTAYLGIGAQVHDGGVGEYAHESREEMKRQLEETLTRSGEIPILPGYKESPHWSNPRPRPSIKIIQPTASVLPIHDGGGDGPRPPSQSYNNRVVNARKAAQLEYKAQLDQQIAQKQCKEKALQKEKAGNVNISEATPTQFTPSPSERKAYLPSWFTPTQQNTPQHVQYIPVGNLAVNTSHTSTISTQTSVEALNSTPSDGIRFSPFPILSSSKQDENISTNDKIPSKGNSQEQSQKFRSSIFPALSESEHANQKSDTSAAPSFSFATSTPITIPMRQNVEQNGEEFRIGILYAEKTTNQMAPMQNGFSQQITHESISPIPSKQSFGSPRNTTCQVKISPAPHIGSPSESNCSEKSNYFGSPASPRAYKPHVSQTTDQRPDESILRNAYKNELEQQIQLRKRLEEERLVKERLEEERLQEKIKRDQERMLKEYEEEQLKLKKKEEERIQRQNEIAKREEAVRIKLEEERKKKMEEKRRQFLEVQAQEAEPVRRPTAPCSPPIRSMIEKHEHLFQPEEEEPITTHDIEEAEEASEKMWRTPASGNTGRSQPYTRRQPTTKLGERPTSTMTETLNFLTEVREILASEMAEAQIVLERTRDEFNILDI